VKPSNGPSLLSHDAQIQVAGEANVKRAFVAAENVDVAAGLSKMLASSWFSAQGKDRGGSARCVPRWLKSLRAAWVRQAPPGSFDSAPPSAVSRDKSVRRFAQDDVFAAGRRDGRRDRREVHLTISVGL
jgi:hypothetical protein